MKTLKVLKRELLENPRTKAAYDAMASEYEMARELIGARVHAGLSQEEVAQRMGTTQSVVARLESGKHQPSMRTVQRFAQAVGGKLVLQIKLSA